MSSSQLRAVGVSSTGSVLSSSKNTFQGVLQSLYDNKKTINNSVLSVGAITNGLIFLNGNFNFFDIDNGVLEKVGNFFARLGTFTRGFTGSFDCYFKNNLIPWIGNVLELPIAMFTSGEKLWLARGISQSIRQMQGLIKNRFIDKVTLSDNRKVRLKTDNFKKYGIGMMDGSLYSLKEIGKVFKELCTNPFDKKNLFSNTLMSCSLLQFIGPIIAFSGLYKLGAFLRDLGGALVDVAYMMKTSYFGAGACWIVSAVSDYGKLWDPVNDTIKNLTQLSNTGDPVAAMFESNANFESVDEVQTISFPQSKQKRKAA